MGLRLDDVEEDQIPLERRRQAIDDWMNVDGEGSCRSQSTGMGNGSELAKEPVPCPHVQADG